MLALVALMMGAGSQHDGLPFVMTALFFLASFISLGAMFWPYMIPYSIAGGAAAPDASLQFLFYGGCGAAGGPRLRGRCLLGFPRQNSQKLSGGRR
jgi:cytochrome bd-type quinol oxidase subunit 2